MSIRSALVFMIFLLPGCAGLPLGPSVPVMPAPGKPFDLFVDEEYLCRRFAEEQVGISPQQAVQQEVTTGAVVGTAIGAAAGTAIGAAAGDIGTGAIVGSGMGLMGGSAAGAGSGAASSWAIQRRYDIAYEQCMYAKGNQLPGYPTTYSAMPFGPPPR